MNSFVTRSFREDFARLPKSVQVAAREKYRFWKQDPHHPSLHFKPVGSYWSARINQSYRALGRKENGTMYWFRIIAHDEYERLIA